MPTVYVIHDSQDSAIVEDVLIRPLPILGVDSWVSSHPDSGSVLPSDPTGDVEIAVVSEAATQSDHVRSQLARVVAGKRPIIPVRIDNTEPARVSADIAALPWVALRTSAGVPDLNQLRRDIGDLLPLFTDHR